MRSDSCRRSVDARPSRLADVTAVTVDPRVGRTLQQIQSTARRDQYLAGSAANWRYTTVKYPLNTSGQLRHGDVTAMKRRCNGDVTAMSWRLCDVPVEYVRVDGGEAEALQVDHRLLPQLEHVEPFALVTRLEEDDLAVPRSHATRSRITYMHVTAVPRSHATRSRITYMHVTVVPRSHATRSRITYMQVTAAPQHSRVTVALAPTPGRRNGRYACRYIFRYT